MKSCPNRTPFEVCIVIRILHESPNPIKLPHLLIGHTDIIVVRMYIQWLWQRIIPSCHTGEYNPSFLFFQGHRLFLEMVYELLQKATIQNKSEFQRSFTSIRLSVPNLDIPYNTFHE